MATLQSSEESSSRLAVGYASGAVAVIDVLAQTSICSFRNRAPVQSLAWTASYEHLVVACQDQSVNMWKVSVDGGSAELSDEVWEAPGRHTGGLEGKNLDFCACNFKIISCF
jgi:hypothetical protein